MSEGREHATGLVDATGELILVANDHEWTARSLETILVATGYGVVRTFTGRETLEVASQRLPDLLILDHQLPDISGLDVCRRLRSDPLFGASTPIMITTAGPSGRTQRLAAYEAGAWEFYGQPLDGEALLHKVRVFLAARATISARTGLVLVDAGTGLYSRAGLLRRAEEMAAEAKRRGATISCVAVTATGPDDGAVNAKLLNALRLTARTADAKGRLGPMSFAVIGATDEAGARRLAQRLRDALGNDPTVRVAVATSAGAVVATTADALLSEVTTGLAA